jgi:transaldolase
MMLTTANPTATATVTVTDSVEDTLATAMAAFDANGSQGPVLVPATPAGLEAITLLSQVGLSVTATAVKDTSTGMLAAIAGADYLQMDIQDLRAQGVDPLEAIASLAAMLLATSSPATLLATGWTDTATARAAEAAGAIAAS